MPERAFAKSRGFDRSKTAKADSERASALIDFNPVVPRGWSS